MRSIRYLRMARQVRQAVSNLELPQFHLESTQTRLLIDLMQSREVPLGLWEEMVAPHAHHYFPAGGECWRAVSSRHWVNAGAIP